jgi:hypothetical protein
MAYNIFPLPPLVYPQSTDTLGEMIAEGLELHIICHTFGCHNESRVNLVALAKRIGPQHSCLSKDIQRYFHCSRCRAAGKDDRNVSFRHHAGGYSTSCRIEIRGKPFEPDPFKRARGE